MGLWSDSSKNVVVKETQKWQYINLSDFKNKSCLTFFSYVWIWILVIVAIAVYAADTFTAYKLLKFDRWSSELQPKIDFKISKWIFAGCIIFSWVICIYEWIRALRVMRKESVTEDYLDPLAVVLQSIRFKGGWRRYLVFAELTKSRKKAAWVALFVYFERKGCLRILGAEGPRQVVNAVTLWSVVKANIIPTGALQAPQGRSPIIQFFINLKSLADKDATQAVILSSMAFTLVIWAICMIFLIMALLFYVFFIWHYVKNETLTGYCRRKVETRLARIVKDKTDKIWAKQQEKEEREAKEKGGLTPSMKRQPTLPVFDVEDQSLKGGSASFISRTDSNATLPRYTSQPQTPADEYPPPLPRQPTLPNMGSRGGTSRPYSPEASLLGQAGPMGTSNPPYPRPGTSSSNRSYGSSTRERRYSPQSATSSTPWRTPVSSVNEMQQEYELQDGPSLPSALRPAMNRREFSNPEQRSASRGPLPPPNQRSFTAPVDQYGGPRSATPGSHLGRSMTPGASMMGPGRGGTPGPLMAAPSRIGTPGAGMVLTRNMTPTTGMGPPSRSGTPGAGMSPPRNGTPGASQGGQARYGGGPGNAI